MTPHLNHFRSPSQGTPVFFQHGLCGTAAQTQEIFPTDPRFQLNTLECRGHGFSEIGPYTDISVKTFANDLAAYINQPSIIGGISMGAAISLHLAVYAPHLVKALVLARPAWLIANAPSNMQPNLEVGQLLKNHPPAVAKEKFTSSALGQHLAKAAPDNMASLLTFFAREPFEDMAALLTNISADGPGVTKTQVRALKIPTLIIATEKDYIHPVIHAEALHDLIPNSRLAVITPKGVDKQRYVLEFQSTLLKFFEENI
jgi:pimeloyl-ACP methyl ester carboxylesterase